MKRLPNRSLRASTLAELMVVMIVAGIVFICVTDGLGMVQRFTLSLTGCITASTRFYDDYYRLERLITTADSISILNDDHNAVCIYCAGVPKATIHYADSALIVTSANSADTLLSHVAAMQPLANLYTPNLADTISITLSPPLTIDFAITASIGKTAGEELEKQEKNFTYKDNE